MKTGLARSAVLFAFVTLAVLLLVPRSSSGQRPASFVIRHVRVFDGERVEGDRMVVVENGWIKSVGPPGSDPSQLPALDGAGATLMPGLIDAHTHTTSPGQLHLALVYGVTTCLDMGTPRGIVPTLRGAAASRTDVADFRSAGTPATAPGGHGTEPTAIVSRGGPIPTIADATQVRPFVSEHVADGADYLKLILNGVRAARRGTPTLPAPIVKALIDEAHTHHLLAIAHIESTDDARTVAESGGDGLAHAWRDKGDSPETAELLAKRRLFVIPTAAIPDAFSGGATQLLADARLRPYLPDSIVARFQKPDSTHATPPAQFLAAVRSLYAAGVRLVAGTDAGTPWKTAHGLSLHRELELYVQAGLSPIEALRTATANAADAFGLNDRGRIAAGRRADLVLVRGDPTANITVTRDILHVWRAGVEVQRASETTSGADPTRASRPAGSV